MSNATWRVSAARMDARRLVSATMLPADCLHGHSGPEIRFVVDESRCCADTVCLCERGCGCHCPGCLSCTG